MEEELKVKIIGDSKQLDQSAKEAANSLKELERKANSLKKAISENGKLQAGYVREQRRLNKQLDLGQINSTDYAKALARLKKVEQETEVATKDLEKELRGVNKASQRISKTYPKATKSIKGVKKSTANATPTMLEFNRVIQDAPFGIQGVANNITQLTQNFGYLQKQAGGTKAALKSLISSFAGPAGILFAVSAVTSLLVTYGDKLFDAKTESEKLAEAQEKATEELEKFVKQLEALKKVRLEGNKAATDELTTLKLLRRQAQNTTLTTEQRTKAAKKLQELYPKYLENVKTEDILIGNVGDAYQRLTSSILAKAKAQAAADRIADNATKELDLQIKLTEKQFELNEQLEKQKRAQRRLASQTPGSLSGVSAGANASQDLDAAKNAVKDLREEILSTQGAIQQLQLENIELTDFVDTQGGLQIEDVELTESGQEAKDKILEGEFQITGIKGPVSTGPPDETGIEGENSGDLGRYGGFENYTNAIGTLTDSASEAMKGLTKVVTEETKKQAEDFLKLEAVAAGVELGLKTGLNTLADAMIQNFDEADSGFERFVASFLANTSKIIAASLSQSIAQAIVGGSTAGAATGPAAVATTPAFVATLVGTVLSAFAAIPKFQQGGIVGGGSYVGDKIPILANAGEQVLTRQDRTTLDRVLEGNLSGVKNLAPEAIEIYGALRNDQIHLSNKRAARTNKRFS